MEASLPLTHEAITDLPVGRDRMEIVNAPSAFVGVKAFQPREVFANHYHEGYDEIFIGLEGALTIWQGRNARTVVRPGTSLRCPRGSHHMLINETDTVAKVLFAKAPLIDDDTVWVDWTPPLEGTADGL